MADAIQASSTGIDTNSGSSIIAYADNPIDKTKKGPKGVSAFLAMNSIFTAQPPAQTA